MKQCKTWQTTCFSQSFAGRIDFRTFKYTVMYRKHKTKDGRKMQICEMEDSHLMRTISLMLRHLTEVNNALDGKSVINTTPSQLAMRGVRKEHVGFDELASVQQGIIDKLYAYLAEALLRGRYEIVPEVQEAFGRSGQVQPLGLIDSKVLMIGDADDLIDIEEDNEHPF